MKNKLLITLILLTSALSFAQKKITWEDLAKVKYEKKYLPAQDEYFDYPNFSPSVKALEGKKVIIVGYFLNIDPKGELFVLSKGPMASCFFCGIGGPETAIEIQFTSKPTYKTDDIVIITGILKLNSDDIEHFNYILTESTGEIIN
ncbi:MAG: hypothetical protein AB8B65_04120 [Kordia sp.]|uniref:hypothetical protein n=1 Tax=Kordia sp. TaxID=1965332 RepID=UPI00385EFAE1